MIRLYSRPRAEQAIEREAPFIREVAERYGVPVSWIKGILLKEMTELNLMDLLADLAVRFYYFRYHLLKRVPKSKGAFLGKNDSSTGWGQIYAFCAIDSLNFAADRGIARYEDFGLTSDCRLDKAGPDDRWLIWKRLHGDRHFNIEMCALTLRSCAEERTGKQASPDFSPEEIKQTFTRYNGNVPHITRYAEQAYQFYQEYQEHTAQQL